MLPTYVCWGFPKTTYIPLERCDPRAKTSPALGVSWLLRRAPEFGVHTVRRFGRTANREESRVTTVKIASTETLKSHCAHNQFYQTWLPRAFEPQHPFSRLLADRTGAQESTHTTLCTKFGGRALALLRRKYSYLAVHKVYSCVPHLVAASSPIKTA